MAAWHALQCVNNVKYRMAHLQRISYNAADGGVAGAPHRAHQLARADNACEVRHRLLHIPVAQPANIEVIVWSIDGMFN